MLVPQNFSAAIGGHQFQRGAEFGCGGISLEDSLLVCQPSPGFDCPARTSPLS